VALFSKLLHFGNIMTQLTDSVNREFASLALTLTQSMCIPIETLDACLYIT